MRSKKIESLREQELDEIKGKLNMLDDEINDILENLDVDLRTLKLRCNFLGKRHDFEDKIELRLSAKNRINEIKRLKDETKNNKDELLDHLLDNENKLSKLLTDLEYEKNDTLHKISVLESKLINLEISPGRINRIKNSVLSS